MVKPHSTNDPLGLFIAHANLNQMVMHYVLIFLLVLCAKPSAGLSNEEETALKEIVISWPVLTVQSPPWDPLAASLACSPPWYGLQCSDGPDKRIIGLSLSSLNLNNTIPDALSELNALQSISIIGSSIGSTIPSSLQKLVSLQNLEFRFNDLDGAFPSWVTRLPSLRRLVLIEPLTGSLPDNIGTLTALEELMLGYLSNPSLGGSIPRSVAKLQNLEVLDLSSTEIGGDIPPEIGLLPKLRVLNFGETKLNGTVPTEIWSLSKLEILDLSQSDVIGPLPYSFEGVLNLKELILDGSKVRGSLAPSIGQLVNLTTLSLANSLISGALPSDLGRLRNVRWAFFDGLQFRSPLPLWLSNWSLIESLSLSKCDLTGTIPEALTSLRNLKDLDISANSLSGSIPPFRGTFASFQVGFNLLTGTLDSLDHSDFHVTSLGLESNKLSGTLPSHFRGAHRIDLSHNRLSGTIPWDLSEYPDLEHLNLANNRLEGSVPILSNQVALRWFDLSGNMLTGTIPSDYASNVSFSLFRMKDNKLTGTLPPSLFRSSNLYTLDLSFNGFSGTIPDLGEMHKLAVLSLGNNRLRGSIPRFPQPSELVFLDLSHNHFGGVFALPYLPKLTSLDISYNFFNGHLFSFAGLPALEQLSVAHNGFVGPVVSMPPLIHVDLSNNSFTGRLPRGFCADGRLLSVDLSNNQFEGSIPADFLVDLSSSPAITQCKVESLNLANNKLLGTLHTLELDFISFLDISHNEFCFDSPEVTNYPSLLTFRGSDNYIFGTLTLAGMSLLETADYSFNELNVSFDFTFIGAKFNSKLQYLSISNNPIPRTKSLNGTDLSRTSSSHSLAAFPLIDCYTLGFKTARPVLFNYDDELFDFQQCDCTTGFFGQPPDRCGGCPAPLACIGSELIVPPGYYAYLGKPTDIDGSLPSIFVEPCARDLYTRDETSCKGSQISDGDLHSIATISQCDEGSEGRMCTRCVCETTGGSDCFFPRGSACVRCKKTFSVALTIVLISSVLLLAFSTLTFVMWTVLNSRRTKQSKRWDELAISKRFVYRVIHGVGLGLTPIGINFVQLLSEITHWDSYALRSWARIMNGETDGLGIDCLFPSLSQPFPLLFIRLLLPVIASLFVIVSIIVAEAIYKARKPKTQTIDFYEDTHILNTQEGDQIPLIAEEKPDMDYPVTALITTSTISIIQFFYFGTTLAATEYFFSAPQPGTAKKYVQSRPWMDFKSAAHLRHWSIPSLVLFTLILPVAFLIVVWRIRGSVTSQKTFIYFGTLFTRYNTRYFWWEIVSVILRLAVALALRGISPTSALQPATMVACLMLVLILTTSLQPWRRQIENLMAPISTALLLSCLFASHTGNLTSSHTFTIATQVASGIFILVLILFILYLAVTSDTDYIRRFQGSSLPHLTRHMDKEAPLNHPKVIRVFSEGLELHSEGIDDSSCDNGDFTSDGEM